MSAILPHPFLSLGLFVASILMSASLGAPSLALAATAAVVLPHVMRLLGAEVRSVTSGSQTLKDAMNEALRDWVTNVADTFYCIGTVAGPHPYPAMVRDFQAIIGRETRWQLEEQEGEGRLPDTVIAAIGGGSKMRAAVRVVVGGALALVVTYAVGALLGGAVGATVVVARSRNQDDHRDNPAAARTNRSTPGITTSIPVTLGPPRVIPRLSVTGAAGQRLAKKSAQ